MSFLLKQCILGLVLDGVVQMKLEGCCKICLLRSVTERPCFPQTEWSVRAMVRVCAYMQICVITHPSESHTGIYTQSPQVTSPLIRSCTRWFLEKHGREATCLFHPREKQHCC